MFILFTVFSLGMNLLIPRIRKSRWAKYVFLVMIASEARACYTVYLVAPHFKEISDKMIPTINWMPIVYPICKWFVFTRYHLMHLLG